MTKTILNEQQIQEMLNLYQNEKLPLAKVAKMYHMWPPRFKQLLLDRKIHIRNREDAIMFKGQIEQEIIKLYNENLPMREIINRLNLKCTQKPIKNCLKRNGVRMRNVSEYDLNRDYKGVYIAWLNKYGQEIADKKFEIYREKLRERSSGKNNPMYGKPTPNGSGNGFKCWYKNIFFRSLKELGFFIEKIEKHNLFFETAERAKFTIHYKLENRERTYKPDFLLENRYLIEIKPKKLHTSRIVTLKRLAAEKFCQENGLVYVLLDHITDFKIIKEYYNQGLILPQEKYKERFEKYLNN